MAVYWQHRRVACPFLCVICVRCLSLADLTCFQYLFSLFQLNLYVVLFILSFIPTPDSFLYFWSLLLCYCGAIIRWLCVAGGKLIPWPSQLNSANLCSTSNCNLKERWCQKHSWDRGWFIGLGKGFVKLFWDSWDVYLWNPSDWMGLLKSLEILCRAEGFTAWKNNVVNNNASAGWVGCR